MRRHIRQHAPTRATLAVLCLVGLGHVSARAVLHAARWDRGASAASSRRGHPTALHVRARARLALRMRGGSANDMAEEEAIESALRLKALGNDLIREGDCASAAVKYHEALRALAFDGAGSAEAANLDRRCRLNLASCYIRMGEWEDAVEQCDLVRRPPPRVPALEGLRAPASVLRGASRRSPHSRRGSLRSTSGCAQVLAHFPACSKALCKRAQSREAAGELADALADYTAASKLMSEVRFDTGRRRARTCRSHQLLTAPHAKRRLT